MKLFRKKTKIVLRSLQQKESMVEKLENAHIAYDLREDRDDMYGEHPTFVIRVYADDYAKVI